MPRQKCLLLATSADGEAVKDLRSVMPSSLRRKYNLSEVISTTLHPALAGEIGYDDFKKLRNDLRCPLSFLASFSLVLAAALLRLPLTEPSASKNPVQ